MRRLDALTREAIQDAIQDAMAEAREQYDEVWLTADDLCSRLPMFTRDWLKRYGAKVPRERITYTDDATQTVRHSRWMYPLHRIERAIRERRFADLKVNNEK